eukprot:1162152-Pelagomonas_calceolata.AAC.3
MMWRDISSAPIPCPHLLANKWNVSFSPEEPAKQFQPWRCRHELRLRAITHAAKAMQHHKEKKGKTTQARSGCIPWEAYKAYERRRLAINEKAVAAANSQQSRQRSGFTWPMGNAAGSSSMSQHTEEMRKQQQRQEPQPATGEERRIMNLAAIAARASRLWRQRHEVVMLAPTSCLHYCCLEHSEGVQVGLGGVSQQSCCILRKGGSYNKGVRPLTATSSDWDIFCSIEWSNAHMGHINPNHGKWLKSPHNTSCWDSKSLRITPFGAAGGQIWRFGARTTLGLKLCFCFTSKVEERSIRGQKGCKTSSAHVHQGYNDPNKLSQSYAQLCWLLYSCSAACFASSTIHTRCGTSGGRRCSLPQGLISLCCHPHGSAPRCPKAICRQCPDSEMTSDWHASHTNRVEKPTTSQLTAKTVSPNWQVQNLCAIGSAIGSLKKGFYKESKHENCQLGYAYAGEHAKST